MNCSQKTNLINFQFQISLADSGKSLPMSAIRLKIIKLLNIFDCVVRRTNCTVSVEKQSNIINSVTSHDSKIMIGIIVFASIVWLIVFNKIRIGSIQQSQKLKTLSPSQNSQKSGRATPSERGDTAFQSFRQKSP